MNQKVVLSIKDGLQIKEPISSGEKIVEAEWLSNILGMVDKISDFTMVAKPKTKKVNVQFVDKNTLVAIRDIKPGEKLIPYYPKWMKKWITAPNMFSYYLLQFITVLLLVVISIVIIWLFI